MAELKIAITMIVILIVTLGLCFVIVAEKLRQLILRVDAACAENFRRTDDDILKILNQLDEAGK